MYPEWTKEKKKAVTFSYDDGVTQDFRLVELLNKYNLKCTFNINSELLGTHGRLIRNGMKISHYKVHPSHVKMLYEGHEVAVHTLTHPNLTELPEDEIIRQVEEDRKNLEGLVGYPIVGMAYPCGGVNNDDRVAKIIKNNTKIKYCRTITNTDSFDMQENLYRFNPNVYHIMEFDRMMEMGKRFIEMKPDKPQIFYIWGHSYEMDFTPEDWNRLEEFFRLISGHEDIFYGTNKEVLLGEEKNKTKIRSYIIAVIVVALMFSVREILPTRVFITLGVIGMLLGPVGVFLLDRCFKKKGETNKLIYMFNEVFMWLGFSSFFVLGIYGFMYSFENDSFLPFWAVSLLVGIASGIFITVIMVKTTKKAWTVLVGLLIAVFITFLASIYISHLNYVLDTTEPTQVKAVILDKDVTRRRKSPDEYSFEIEIDGREFDVKVSHAEYEKYEVGDIYSFKKYSGAFGEPFYISE